jgi:hypothetical protein
MWKKKSIEDYASAIAITIDILTIMKTQGGVLPGRQDLPDYSNYYKLTLIIISVRWLRFPLSRLLGIQHIDLEDCLSM